MCSYFGISLQNNKNNFKLDFRSPKNFQLHIYEQGINSSFFLASPSLTRLQRVERASSSIFRRGAVSDPSTTIFSRRPRGRGRERGRGSGKVLYNIRYLYCFFFYYLHKVIHTVSLRKYMSIMF